LSGKPTQNKMASKIIITTCNMKSCNNKAIFGTNKRARCGKHKDDDDYDLTYRFCSCNKIARFGIKEGQPTCCKVCKTKKMKIVVGEKCFCGKKACYGSYGIQRVCESDRLPRDQEIDESSNDDDSSDEDYTDSGSDSESDSDDEYQSKPKYRKNKQSPEKKEKSKKNDDHPDLLRKYQALAKEVKELKEKSIHDAPKKIEQIKAVKSDEDRKADRAEEKVKKYLQKNLEGVDPIYNKSIGKLKYKTDIRYEFEHGQIIIEIDEDQHKDYDILDEKTRMKAIQKELDVPCIFFRFNPDGYTLETNKKQVSFEKRLSMLLDAILGSIADLNEDENNRNDIVIFRLFFDHDVKCVEIY